MNGSTFTEQTKGANMKTELKDKVINDTYYNEETTDKMIQILESLRSNKTRVRFHWEDTKTGLDWGDVYDVTGHISRSTGPKKIPILINNARSMGGGGILTHCIVKITTTRKPKKIIYQHPNYHQKGKYHDTNSINL